MWLLRLLAGPLLRLLGVLGIYAKGRADARTKTALEAAEEYAEIRRRMDHAEVPMGSDDLRKWLRNRDPRD